jgi:hypothetical protein
MVASIRDLLPPPVEINLGRGTLQLRGLSLEDVVSLITKHKEAFSLFFANEGDPDMSAIVATAPDMVAEIIAKAANMEDQKEDVKLIPAALQLVALTAVWEASVPDPLAVRKAIERLQGEVSKLKKAP